MDISHKAVHQSCSDFLQSAEDKEWECFHSQLKDIPHSFLMENQELVSTNSLRRFKDVLRSDLRYGFKTGVETARSRNLLAYVLVSLRQFPEALSQTEEALKTEGEQHNLVSLANKAVILWQMGRRQEAQHEVSVIQGMKQDLADFDYLKIKAKAELAFSYNRMGPALYDHAERLFPEVIAEAREPEVWLWKFGLAMTKRRFLNFQHAPVLSGSKDTAKLRETLRQTLGLFLDITQNCHDSSLKAKAYAELAVLLNMKWDGEMREILTTEVNMSSAEACEKALELDGNDCSVLWKSGRLLSRRGDSGLEKARDLLEKAVALRPSTAEYHHLGLVYRQLAERPKRLTENQEMLRQQEGGIASGGVTRSSEGTPQTDHGHPGQNETEYGNKARGDSEGPERASEKAAVAEHEGVTKYNCLTSDLSNLRLPRDQQSDTSGGTTSTEGRENSSAATTPVQEPTEVSWYNIYVQKSIECMRKSVELSQEENMPAVQDLALLYKDMGDYDQALALLEKILQGRQFSMGPLDKVTAYKHAGLLLKEMSEREEDGDKKRELDKRGESMLNMALLTASRLCSKLHVPHLHRQVPDIWQSFSTLLKAADQSDRKPHEKVREKARLFQLIKDHKQSIRLLQAMEELAPEEAGNPDHLKMFIDSYVGLQQYEEALAVIEILQSTSESSAIIKLFDDKHYVQKVYMQAAKQALLEPSIQSQLSRVYFHSAFTDIYCGPDSGSTTEDSSTTEEEQGDKEKEEWDVMLLHEGSAEDKATMLASVLQDVFGLKVTRMDQHVLLGRLRLEGVTRTIRRSRLVVVLANERHISGELRYYVTCAAKKKNTVTLLTSDGHVPKMLKKSHRHMVCPGQLLTGLPTQPHPRDQGDDQYSEATVAAMCDLFSFLVDVPDWAASLT